MKERVTGTVSQTGIKQVVIDEAQDYSLVQYKLISNVFRNAQITILGDLNQSIMPFVNYSNYDSILSVLKEDRVHSKVETQYLTKTYRSTVEISSFANKVIGVETTPTKNQLDRHGEEVKVFQDVSSGDKSLIVKHAKELKTEDNTVAIIFKTAKECKDFQKSLGRTATSKLFTFMVDGNNDFVNNKIMVLPLYMAKGLEFDVVLIPRANEDNFNKKNKKLFYVASTRAMNTLRIYYDEVPSSLIL
jgi:DNA helicase-2/ATP-dependent DNA helicase PcrA